MDGALLRAVRVILLIFLSFLFLLLFGLPSVRRYQEKQVSRKQSNQVSIPLTGQGGNLQIRNRGYPGSFHHPGGTWQCNKKRMVGASARKPGHLSIRGSAVWWSRGYHGMHRGKDFQPVCDHQGRHPRIYLADFFHWSRPWHRGLHLHVSRNRAHHQHRHQHQPWRRDNTALHNFPRPFKLSGIQYILQDVYVVKVYPDQVYIHDKDFFLINDNPYGLPSIDRRLYLGLF